jgi:L-seryl-tRNA(Ser) seleniumtransferase
VGTAPAIARCRSNPLARALRADKLTLAGLEATLALYREPARAIQTIPVLRMLTLSGAELANRARGLAAVLPLECRAETAPGESAVGGGAFPGAALPTTLVLLDPGPEGANRLALRLRLGEPPVVARVQADRVALDPRTLPPDSYKAIATAVAMSVRD